MVILKCFQACLWCSSGRKAGKKKEENMDVLLFVPKALYRINAFSG